MFPSRWSTTSPARASPMARLLLALAAHDDYGRAAEALNKGHGSLTSHRSHARRELFGWCQQAEPPAGV